MATPQSPIICAGLEQEPIRVAAAHWNLEVAVLTEHAVCRREGVLAQNGALAAVTGQFTGRSPKDKFIVREPSSQDQVWWGSVNQPIDPARFDALYARMRAHMQASEIYVLDCFAGASPGHRFPVRIITELAWHNLFCRQLFIRPEDNRPHTEPPQLTVIDLPSFHADPEADGTRSETFVIVHLAKRLVIIGGTSYAGEMKKSVFSVLNFLLPLARVMPMHCSANVGPQGEAALFFGLSGTGKTTLSADPGRGLIGDDEHGWNDDGVFNFEGGCYAKVINLSPKAEPQIFACTQKFGTILENVPYDPVTRMIDLNDDSITENTRASYPLEYNDNAIPEKMAGHPKNIVLLTCDASGVMPPIAKLTPDQALYQFISGYTSKLAGTEAGLGKEPEITFSTCFGAPFMVHHPYFYADLLKRKIERYGAHCWLVNTGWIGGPYGIGERISITYTRALLNAALSGDLLNAEFCTDPIFGFQVPKSCADVPPGVLDPASSWPSRDEYTQKYRQLAFRFVENFKKFAEGCP